MSQWYNLTGYQPAGDPWSNEHGTFQGYWADLEGVEDSVLLNKKQGTLPKMGAVYGDLVVATSQSGNRYYRFKSAKPPQGEKAPTFGTNQQAPAPAAQPAPAPAAQPAPSHTPANDVVPQWFIPVYNMIKYVYDYMKEMREGELSGTATGAEATNKGGGGVEVVPGSAPVSEEEQAKLDGIFGEPPTDPPKNMPS